MESYNYLGVILDKFLDFSEHVAKVVSTANKLQRGCAQILSLKGLEDQRKVWVYKTVVRPIITYGCPIWLLLSPCLMAAIRKAEYVILRGMFGQFRRRNGHYYSYRSRLMRAKIPSVDYQCIRLARRHLIRLDGSECATVDQANPRWAENVFLIRQRLFTPESVMFIDAMGILQDRRRRNVFFSLDRHGHAHDFDLDAALAGVLGRRPCPLPTKYDLESCQIDAPWLEWEVPTRYLNLD